MLQTTNYNLNKIELTDSPPDITVINPNWDSIDAEMKSLRELNNSLGKSSLVNLGYVTTGTCVAFIQGKIAEGYKTGLFVATALSDMPEGGLVLYYSSTNVTGSVTVELHSQTTDYLARINNSTGAYITNWKKFATDYIASSLATVEKMPSEYPVGMTMEYTGDRAIDGVTWVELLTYRGSTAGEAIQYAFTYRYSTTKDILRYRTSANSAGSTWGAWLHIVTDKQPDWIVATLQNGWTGEIKYRKTQIGQLEITGYVLPGTKTMGTTIFTLPTGYIPLRASAVLSYNADGNVISGLTLLNDGRLCVYNPATTMTTVNHFISVIIPLS